MSYALRLMVISLCLNICLCQRRITGIKTTTVDKRFMVYLVQSNQSHPKRHAWLCGGALVKTNKILTSAACLIESSNIYAIAGYRKYISTDQLNKDNCTRITKRRVIKTCVPHGYILNTTNSTAWMTLDIGVAVVERPYRPTDTVFKLICDYIPKSIPILYHKEFVYTKFDAVAYGWGFARGRRPSDEADYNSKILKHASIYVEELSHCIESYDEEKKDLIEKYMWCAVGHGYLDDDGRSNINWNHDNLGCGGRRYGDNGEKCDEMEVNSTQMFDTRRQMPFNTNLTSNEKQENQSQTNKTRRQVVYSPASDLGPEWLGLICQNDHGGPLVTWIGVTEILIGVAVNTIYDDNYNCVGPALFTSTVCTGNIIMCMLSDNPDTRRTYEQIIKAEGFEIIQRNIEWADDPDEHSTPAPAASVKYKQENTTTRLNATTGRTPVPK